MRENYLFTLSLFPLCIAEFIYSFIFDSFGLNFPVLFCFPFISILLIAPALNFFLIMPCPNYMFLKDCYQSYLLYGFIDFSHTHLSSLSLSPCCIDLQQFLGLLEGSQLQQARMVSNGVLKSSQELTIVFLPEGRLLLGAKN